MYPSGKKKIGNENNFLNKSSGYDVIDMNESQHGRYMTDKEWLPCNLKNDGEYIVKNPKSQKWRWAFLKTALKKQNVSVKLTHIPQ